tara:strand:- start:1756 stop:3840 length:2085 start_codon:yes stop_codon:yes gene_type:complete
MGNYEIGVDIGGTFTDVILIDPSGRVNSHKLLSTPDDFSNAMIKGIEQICARANIEPSSITKIVHGTTVVTNACIEMKGAKVGLLTTQGFRDILEIGRGRLPAVLDLSWEKPPPLVPRYLRREVIERIDGNGKVKEHLDHESVEVAVKNLLDENIESIAVCLINSPANPIHEIAVSKIIKHLAPNIPLSISSEVMPMYSEYERTSEVTLNAYVMPLVKQYLTSLKQELKSIGISAPLYIMQSNGGMTTPENAMARPIEIIECGPAAGVVGATRLSDHSHSSLITFDMGGTTAKASIVEEGQVSHAREYEVGGSLNRASRLLKGSGYVVRVASIDIAEIGAGGGSILKIDAGGGVAIGPESAGADPGPACYDLGGINPTIADADLVLGYINPKHLCGGTYPLNSGKAEKALASDIGPALGLDVVEAAYGIYQLANARMMRAIKSVSSERGRDPSKFSLHAFGGAGPVHAAGVAKGLGMNRIVIPPAPGVFSAFGLLTGNIERHFSRSFSRPWNKSSFVEANSIIDDLEKEASSTMSLWAGKDWDNDLSINRLMDLQYEGQGSSLSIALRGNSNVPTSVETIADLFETLHKETFGHFLPNHPIRTTGLRLIASISASVEPKKVSFNAPAFKILDASRPAYWGPNHGLIDTPVETLANIRNGLHGPILIDSYDTTIVVPPNAWVEKNPNAGVTIYLD